MQINFKGCLCLQVGDEESREHLIKAHYMVRVGELTTQLQVSDSKAVHFHSEVKFDAHHSHHFYMVLTVHTQRDIFTELQM